MRVKIRKGTEGGLDLIPGKVSFVQFDLKSLYLQLSLTQGILLSYLFGENKDVQGQAIYRVTPKQCNIRIFVSNLLILPFYMCLATRISSLFHLDTLIQNL